MHQTIQMVILLAGIHNTNLPTTILAIWVIILVIISRSLIPLHHLPHPHQGHFGRIIHVLYQILLVVILILSIHLLQLTAQTWLIISFILTLFANVKTMATLIIGWQPISMAAISSQIQIIVTYLTIQVMPQDTSDLLLLPQLRAVFQAIHRHLTTLLLTQNLSWGEKI